MGNQASLGGTAKGLCNVLFWGPVDSIEPKFQESVIQLSTTVGCPRASVCRQSLEVHLLVRNGQNRAGGLTPERTRWFWTRSREKKSRSEDLSRKSGVTDYARPEAGRNTRLTALPVRRQSIATWFGAAHHIAEGGPAHCRPWAAGAVPKREGRRHPPDINP